MAAPSQPESFSRTKRIDEMPPMLACGPLKASIASFSILILLFNSPGQRTEADQNIVGPSAEVRIVIIDSDLNANPLGVDRYENPDFVSFRTSRAEVGEASPEIVETGPSTGIFSFSIQLRTDEQSCSTDSLGDPKFGATGGSEPSVGACPGDLLMVEYTDETTADGRSDIVNYIFEVVSWNPDIAADQITYEPGDRVTVNITDPDANRDPDIADSLSDIRVFSSSDSVGGRFSAIETGKNTGVFLLTFMTASEPQGNSIVVEPGDTLTIGYTDEFPADFESSEEEKEFVFTIQFGGSDVQGELILSAFSARSADSEPVSEVDVGQPVMLSTEILNTMAIQQPFLAVMEVRNPAGVTVALVAIGGAVDPQTKTQAEMSWVPQQQGTYETRAFLVGGPPDSVVISQIVVT